MHYLARMARIKIDLPPHFSFATVIPIRITDINYGGHVGNDTILSIIHESRMQFLAQSGYTEMNLEGVSLIMSDVAIEFKNELFYRDQVKAWVTINDISRVAFSLYYKLEQITNDNDKPRVIAIAKTGMVCYNYDLKKVVALPAAAVQKFGSL